MAERITTKHDIQRDELNTIRPNFAEVTRVFVTGSIGMVYSGVDLGTGDVSLFVTGTWVSKGGDTLTGYLFLPNGTEGAPSYSFDGDSDTGFYRFAADRFGIQAGGTYIATFDNSAPLKHMHIFGQQWDGGANTDGIRFTTKTGTLTGSLFVDETNGKFLIQAWKQGVGYNYPLVLQPLGGSVDITGSLNANGDITVADTKNIILNTSTGTKIGTATTQKLGLWNTTPIVQPTTAITAATFTANTSGIVNDTATFDGYTIGQIVKALRNIGALA